MARPNAFRMKPSAYPVPRMRGELFPAGQKTDDAYFFHGGAPLDFASRLFFVPKNRTPYQKNWRLDRGTMVQRSGSTVMGPGVNSEIIGLTEFKSSNGTTYQIRFTQTTVDIYNVGSNTWVSATGPAFSVSSGSHVYTTSWADTVIFQIDTEKMYQLTPSGPTYVAITTNPGGGNGSHTNGKHITTFAGRVIVSQADQPYRIAWSVKNDNTNWNGLGSGFEDLFSQPGGNADAVLGTYPVSDDQALVVRTRSIWLMVVTGIADAPFRFSRLYDKIPCESPYGITQVPGGIVVPTLDDIFYITPGSIEELGNPIRPRYLALGFNPGLYCASYDEQRGEAVIGVTEGSVTYLNVVYRYSFFDKGWSRDEYSYPIKLFAYSRYVNAGLQISQLVGTIGNLIGTIGALGAGSTGSGLMLCGKAIGGGSAGFGFVVREDANQTLDPDATFGNTVNIPTEIWTGIVPGDGGSLLKRDKVTDVQLEYIIPSGSIMCQIDFSPDGGVSWTSFGGPNPTLTTNVPDSIRFADTQECEQVMMRLTTGTVNNLRINGLHIFTTEGAFSNP